MESIYKTITGENKKCSFKFKIGFTCFEGQSPYFSITGEAWEPGKPKTECYLMNCGALSIGDYIPELAYLDKYHLMSFEGPMHYVANSLYHASNRDYNGLLKGEKRQLKNGKTGQLCWHLVAIDKDTKEEIDLYKLDKSIDSNEKPSCNYSLEFRPWCIVGKGKESDLEAARRCAIWPDAKLEDFTKENLEARLPKLIEQFKSDLLKANIELPKESANE